MVVVGAATVTVGATTPEVQDAVRQVAARVGVDLESSTDNDCGMSAVVEQRIAADKLIRAAYQEHHKALRNLRKAASKDLDNPPGNELVKKYDDQLRDIVNGALNKLGSTTLGREELVSKEEASASLTSAASMHFKCTTETATSGSITPTTPAGGTDLRTVVDKSRKDMDDLVGKAKSALNSLQPAERGPRSKPEDQKTLKPTP